MDGYVNVVSEDDEKYLFLQEFIESIIFEVVQTQTIFYFILI